jgi:threonine dehydratase
VPVGGGGLIGGITAAVAPRGVRVVGVEPEGSAALLRGLEAGEPVAVTPETIASGLDAPFAGTRALEVCAAAGVEVVTVTDAQIAEGMRRLYADAKLACEPAAAAGVAAVLAGAVEGESIVAVVSGGNVGAEIASGILAGR